MRKVQHDLPTILTNTYLAHCCCQLQTATNIAITQKLPGPLVEKNDTFDVVSTLS